MEHSFHVDSIGISYSGVLAAVPNLEFYSWNKRFDQAIFTINSQKRPPHPDLSPFAKT
jgi:hypothetical protein